MLNFLLLILLRILIYFLNLFPYKLRISIIELLLKFLTKILTRYKKIAIRNMELVFPNKEGRFYENLFQESLYSLARGFVDFCRASELDLDWVKTHVDIVGLEQFIELKKNYPNRGFLIVSGHLGSFELFPLCAAAFIGSMSFVARSFKQSSIDNWVTTTRFRYGNKLIPRKGAFKSIMKILKAGENVGLLFDQNVVRNNAVFVNWFGRPAATTKALGMAALRLKIPIVIVSIKSEDLDRYSINIQECDLKDVYGSDLISNEEKIIKITERVTKIFEKLILEDPASWFWMHRRWKTTSQEGESEDFYK